MGINSAPKPRPTMATLIFRALMVCGEYTCADQKCQMKNLAEARTSTLPHHAYAIVAAAMGRDTNERKVVGERHRRSRPYERRIHFRGDGAVDWEEGAVESAGAISVAEQHTIANAAN